MPQRPCGTWYETISQPIMRSIIHRSTMKYAWNTHRVLNCNRNIERKDQRKKLGIMAHWVLLHWVYCHVTIKNTQATQAGVRSHFCFRNQHRIVDSCRSSWRRSWQNLRRPCSHVNSGYCFLDLKLFPFKFLWMKLCSSM